MSLNKGAALFYCNQPHVYMKTNPYKTGVLTIIARIKNYNPSIGEYVSHELTPDMEFLVQLTQGTLKLPPEVAHSQEIFPALVPEEWIREIEQSFVKSLVPVRNPETKSRWQVIFGFFS